MNLFKNPKKEIRTRFELNLLHRVQAMELTKPPEPWVNEVIIAASGVDACGWDHDENIVLISSSGYSITQPITGLQMHRDRDSQLTDDRISGDYLTFKIPCNDQEISIFGFHAGDGIHITEDGWSLEIIYPWWPRASVLLENVYVHPYEYLKNASIIDLKRLDGRIKAGFSPSGQHLLIMGSGGALVYSRSI
ncbi:hypothetical protein QNH46_02785 [Paenibacillus woosongensis]|uniref:Uncharacterized protein n=1 Tax=Paenibacillus woosongensis TaxID=307580 RepID=A0AA95KU57_9BACL|nr:hypothetical protein [Paenibacillus woosongensis]WHX49628.1 hypothetical protein QNH46_02785 [Paenibacillus woosongensis]